VVLSVSLRSGEGSAGFTGEAPYRLLEWDEVEALARAEGMGFERANDTVRLTLPARRA
jgi:hypothetical protein